MKHLNYMRFILFCTILVSRNIWASDQQPSQLLRCLAGEEARLHKIKSSGPEYKLNQLFFNEWSGNPSLELRDDVFERVCSISHAHASVRLLKEFMLGGKSIFKASKIKQNSLSPDALVTMRMITLDELRKQMPQVFFSYVADLEVYAPSAHCLEQKIPELKTLREKYRYLESEISNIFLDEHRKEWISIFSGLERWRVLFDQCKNELKQKKSKS